MKKIGIITFHASHNCGSMLQSFALQKQLNKMGYENEIIDFQSAGQKDMYAPIHKKLTLKNCVKNALALPYLGKIKNQWKDYEAFKKKTFKLSAEHYSSNEKLKSTNDNYDIFISGADQIWNITIPDADDSYFLNFVSDGNKKVAYAPSFGAKKIVDHSNDVEKYNNYLKDYKSLSIRENNGQKWIKEMIGKDIPTVLDPTLLLDKEDYEDIREDYKIDGDYIFYYSPSYKKDIDAFVVEIAKKYNLKVIVWNSREYYVKNEKSNGFVLPTVINPGIYLDLMKNAKLVITTSFHGTIFSTMYKRNFWVIKNGNMYGNDDRVMTLVNQLCLEDRLIEPKLDDSKDYLSDVDYSGFDKELKKLRKKSIDYLKEGIENE